MILSVTENLQVIKCKDSDLVKLQIYSFNNRNGWKSKVLIESCLGVEIEKINYQYIKEKVDKYFINFSESQILTLLKNL